MSDKRLEITSIVRQQRDVQGVTQLIYVSYFGRPAFMVRVRRHKGKVEGWQHFVDQKSTRDSVEYETTGHPINAIFDTVRDLKEWIVR